MKILWMTWKDLRHPLAGGAELLNEEVAKRLARDGHQVTLLVGGFSEGAAEEIRDGYKIIRIGGRYSVYWFAFRYYRKHLRGWADLVIDEMNTIPFFCKFYVKEPNIMLAYQLCREIWFYQMRFPLSVIGYLIEPIYLWLLRDRKVLTESESAKKDMTRFGFLANNISVFSVGIKTEPVTTLQNLEKYPTPTLLSLGAIRAMKQTGDQIKAFELAKKTVPSLKLKIAGGTSDEYGNGVLAQIARSTFKDDIEYFGRVDEATKADLMRKSHFILVTSVKEGWGLIVTEANSQGTPAIVYDVDGLRDSVRNNNTGLVCSKNSPEALAQAIHQGFENPERYDRLRNNAWLWSKELTLENCYLDFLKKAGINERTPRVHNSSNVQLRKSSGEVPSINKNSNI